MLETLRRYREPVAWALLGALALQLLLTILTFALAAAGVGGLRAAGYAAGYPLAGGLVIAAAVVLGSCVYWGQPTSNARLLVLLGAALFAAAVLVDVLVAVIGMVGGSGFSSMLSEILQAALPGLAAVVLFGVWESLPAPVRPRALPGPPPTWGPPVHQQQSEPRRYAPPEAFGRTDHISRRTAAEPTGQSQSDQFGSTQANWGFNSAGNSGTAQSMSETAATGPATEGTGQPAWRPAPQPPPQRLQPEPGDSPVGPHNAAPTSGPPPDPGRNATSARRSRPVAAGADEPTGGPDQDQLPPVDSPPRDAVVDHGPGTPEAPARW